MSEYLNTALFGIYPYIALSVLAIGSIVRYDREPYSWKAGSSQLLRRRQLVLGSVLFHLGVLVVFFGHLVGLLTPIAVFDALGIPHGAKQVLAVVAGGVAGFLALVGATLLMHRRFADPRIRKHSSFADNAILTLLYVQLLLGLGTIFISVQHLDGHEMVTFMNWAQGIFTFDFRASSYIIDAHWIFKTHILLGLTIFLVFPFTRLVHMFSAPLRYIFRQGYQVVRRKPVPGAEK
ncbi:respiratory nitrate reductase subunit gamma [Maricaulis sp.]|uniref:respiratory nitrate reductase subunit gamma n=1 Tax=Maricaulis sp. TaxID=1486257 RepID=UPI003A8E54FD